MHDGFAKLIVSKGYQILHEYSEKGTFGSRDSVRTVILKDGERVLTLEQNWDHRGGTSLSGIYRKAAMDLGLFDPKRQVDPMPVDLQIEERGSSPHRSLEFRHPSFGTVVLGKYSGRTRQFMSPIDTQGGMSLQFKSAYLIHDLDLGTDRVHGEQVLFEVEMSFTQFAEFITSQGQGGGVPCTIKYENGVQIQPCETPTAEQRLEANARRSMDEAVAELTSLVKELDAEMTGAGALSAGRKREIWAKITKNLHSIAGKPQWLLKIWKEHINETLTHAKSEFAHWAQGYVQGTALEGRKDAPSLEGGDKTSQNPDPAWPGT